MFPLRRRGKESQCANKGETQRRGGRWLWASESGGGGGSRNIQRVENTQVIDSSTCQKCQKGRNSSQLERIWNTAFSRFSHRVVVLCTPAPITLPSSSHLNKYGCYDDLRIVGDTERGVTSSIGTATRKSPSCIKQGRGMEEPSGADESEFGK